MLTKLILENFKPFGSEQIANLAPITLVYGPNSGGKSSLIQSLLLLQQSNRPKSTGNLVPRGDLCDLGSFQSLIYRHETDRDLKLSVTFRIADDVSRLPSYYYHKRKPGEHITISLNYSQDYAKKTGAFLPANIREVSYDIGYSDENYKISFIKKSDADEIDISNYPYYLVDETCLAYQFKDDESIKMAADYLYSNNVAIRRRFSTNQIESIHERIDNLKGQVDYLKYRKKEISGDSKKLRISLESKKLKASTESSYKSKIKALSDEKKKIDEIAKDLKEEITRLTERYTSDGEKQDRKKQIIHNLQQSFVLSRFNAMPCKVLSNNADAMESNEHIFNINGFDDITMSFIDQLRTIRYLGPLRSYPERHYLVSGDRTHSVGKTGENTPHLIYEHRAEIISDLNKWLKTFEIPYEIDVDIKDEDEVMGDILTLKLKDVE